MEGIIEKAKKLNRTLPERYLRRNSIYYEYITYINHCIALLIGERYDEVILFIRRSQKFKCRTKETYNYEEEYFLLCEEMITEIIIYLQKNDLLTDIGKQLIEDIK